MDEDCYGFWGECGCVECQAEIQYQQEVEEENNNAE